MTIAPKHAPRQSLCAQFRALNATMESMQRIRECMQRTVDQTRRYLEYSYREIATANALPAAPDEAFIGGGNSHRSPDCKPLQEARQLHEESDEGHEDAHAGTQQHVRTRSSTA
jgi:hypothetical protein